MNHIFKIIICFGPVFGPNNEKVILFRSTHTFNILAQSQ